MIQMDLWQKPNKYKSLEMYISYVFYILEREQWWGLKMADVWRPREIRRWSQLGQENKAIYFFLLPFLIF